MAVVAAVEELTALGQYGREFSSWSSGDAKILKLKEMTPSVGDAQLTNSSEIEQTTNKMALMLQSLEQQASVHNQNDKLRKDALREEYDIGWKVDRIPLNVEACKKLGCEFVPEGMVCLVFDESSQTVQVAPTTSPAGAINLQYLSLALQVRQREGKEPFFSLDPTVGCENREKSMQVKRFEPEWLALTPVGDVLFQADYHLKELSMGECAQPVQKMKSCVDIAGDSNNQEWSAREWFHVRKAEVQITEEGVLIPRVRMGVEAREQVPGRDGLEDKAVSKPSHPLVQYAESFTHNFDLIAERKSVVYHLRELAKASTLAKCLIDTGVQLDDAWFNLADDSDSAACCMEIPQLWNDHYAFEINAQDGHAIVLDNQFASTRSVYGGVQFGLDRFQLSGATRVGGPAAAGLAARSVMTARMGVSPMRAAATGLKTSMVATARSIGPMRAAAGLSAFRTVSPMRAAAGLSATRMASPMRAAAGLTATRMMGAPRGVDMDLGKFDLSAPLLLSTADQAFGNFPISKAFWASIDSDLDTVFNKEDKHFFRAVFSPAVSDRREEGDAFVPPDANEDYVQRLWRLVEEEHDRQ